MTSILRFIIGLSYGFGAAELYRNGVNATVLAALFVALFASLVWMTCHDSRD